MEKKLNKFWSTIFDLIKDCIIGLFDASVVNVIGNLLSRKCSDGKLSKAPFADWKAVYTMTDHFIIDFIEPIERAVNGAKIQIESE